ncbi:MAG: hypothetical protein ISS83_02180 [Candidatus Pacebacteria bacterium]|nr:hypothetical protein [Candidatus Paceibacterota bacterium]
MIDSQKLLKEIEDGKTLKEKIDILMRIEGSMRGELLRDNLIYLKKREGERAVEKMEDRLRELGYPLMLGDIKSYEWYKDPFCAVFMLVFREQFNWNNEDIVNLGRFSPRHSFVMKMAFKYLVSAKTAFWAAPKLWHKNVDYGEIEPHEINEANKYLIFRLKEYGLHPLVCLYIKGYFIGLFELIGKKKVQAEETQCTFRGDPYHEYKISWE